MDYLVNPYYAPEQVRIQPAMDTAAAASVAGLLAQCFDYQPTRLVSLGETAARCGLASVHLKDEGARLGLKSFKALGGAYAVIRLVLQEASRQLGRPVAASELPRPATGSLALPAAGQLDQPGNPEVARIAAGMHFVFDGRQPRPVCGRRCAPGGCARGDFRACHGVPGARRRHCAFWRRHARGAGQL